MASRDVGHLRAVLDAETERFNRALEKSRKQTRKLGQSLKQTKKSTDLFGGALKKLAGPAVAYGLARIANKASMMARRLKEASLRTGFSTDTLRALQMASRDAGVTVETTTMALQRFNRRVGEIANTGRGELAPTFEQLGIAIRDSGGALRDIEDILGEFIGKMNAVESSGQRAALAQKAFDSEGVAFGLQVLKNVTSLEKLRGEIENTGRALDGETLEILEAWDVFLGKLADRADTLGAKLTAALVDPLIQTRSELERIAKVDAARYAPPPGLEGGPAARGTGPGGHQAHGVGAFDRGFSGGERRAAPPMLADPVAALAEWQAAANEWRTNTDALFAKFSGLERVDEHTIAGAGSPGPGGDWLRAEEAAGRANAADKEFRAGLEGSSDLIEEYEKRIKSAGTEYGEFGEAIRSENEIIESSLFGITSGFASSISQALMSGKADFKAFARSAVESITEVIVQQLLLRAVMAGAKAFGFSDGGAISGGSPAAFARGGVVDSPTLFAMGGAGQLGILGEAGPEGILPLRRDPSSGRLGVEAYGSGAPVGGSGVVVNVTNNAENSRPNDERLARTIADHIRIAWNAEAKRQMRPGGTLNPLESGV